MPTFTGPGGCVLSPSFSIARNKQPSSPSSLRACFPERQNNNWPRVPGEEKINYESFVAVLVLVFSICHLT